MSRRAECRACFENGHPDQTGHGAECRAYDAQLAFTRRVRRLLADTTPWYERAVPQAPEYDPRPSYSGLPSGELGVKYVKALRALGPGWERDAMRDWRRPVLGSSSHGRTKAASRRRGKGVAA